MINLKEYQDFVQATTSAESEYLEDFVERLVILEDKGDINMALLLTGAIGMASESGELAEIVKKVVFQGKSLDVFHLMRELGDVMWYWINTCRALGLDPEYVIKENIVKLKARYPTGEFDSFFSENRKENDL